jgi:murein DD-endopeptidase MepM/ murein hydrolase activator NlpD
VLGYPVAAALIPASAVALGGRPVEAGLPPAQADDANLVKPVPASQPDAVRAELEATGLQLTAAQTALVQTESQIQAFKSTMRRQAVDAFVDGGPASSGDAVLSGSESGQLVRTEYVDTVTGDERAATQWLAQKQAVLRMEQARLVADEQAEDAILASAASTQTAVAAAAPLQPLPPPATGYVNPLSRISNLQPKRIDQGVDYSGSGPLIALGSGTIRMTYEGGWPDGILIALQLDSGPLAGQVVYYAENISPTVSVGQRVATGAAVGTLRDAYPNLEIGWGGGGSAGGVIGNTLARTQGQTGGESVATQAGISFNQLLSSLGAPGGIRQG